MGVGGAFDFLTSKLPRAPKVLQSVGLEWAWRLWQQPRRFRRIWNAVVVFPVKVLSQK
jgi:N-acetylglucosaminyldiphosphoundecaprenol N-acetyl-beta-D-mannosaminyltransferase